MFCEAVELCRSVPVTARELARVDEMTLRQGLPTKVRGVDGFAEDRLAHPAQLREGEALTEKAVCDSRVARLAAQPVEGVRHDLAVVEC